MKVLTLLSLLVIFFICCLAEIRSVGALELRCDPGKVYLYSYKQVSNVFGGAYFHVEGTLELYCGKKIHSKKLGTDLTVSSLHFVDAVTYLKPPKCANSESNGGVKTLDFSSSGDDKKCKGTEDKEIKEIEKPKPYKGLERTFGFVQNDNGKILRMFSHKGETAQIRDLKRAIVSQFQTKLHGTSERVVEDNTGVHRAHYSKAVDKKGRVVIKAEHDSEDAIDKETKENAKGTNQHTETLVTLSQSGTVEDVETESSFEFEEENEDGNIPYENDNNNDGSEMSTYVSVSGSMSIKLKGQRTPHSKHTELHKILVLTKQILEGEAKEKDVSDDHDFTIQHLAVLHDKNLEKVGLHQHSTRVDSSEYSVTEDIKNKVEKDHGGFEKLLDKLLEKSESLSLIIQYVERFPDKTLPLIWNRFQQLNDDFKKQSKLQGLMAESQSKKGLDMLLKTMVQKPLNYKLIETGLYYTTSIEKPTVSLAKFVQSYLNFVDTSVPPRHQSIIRTNAFLYLANVASKLNNDDARPFLDTVARRLMQTREERDTELNIIALHNMGRHKSEETAKVLEAVLEDDEQTEEMKILALKALRSHVNDEDGDHLSLSHADALIHKVVNSDSFPDEVKVAAIRTQTHRQKINKNDRSVEKFTEVLKNPETSTEVFDAILDYLKHVQDKERVITLMKPNYDDESSLTDNFQTNDESPQTLNNDEAKPLFFSSVVGIVGNNVNTVTNVAISSVSTVANAAADLLNVQKKAEEAYNAVKTLFFSGDDRDFRRQCYATSSSGNPICVHDPYFKSMFGSVTNDLKNLKNSRHFAWEKRAGNDAVHAYIGFAALAGSHVPSCKDVSEDKALLWASMVGFSSYVKLLIFRLPILEVEFRFNRLKDEGNVDDRIYILAGLVIVRTGLVPGSSIGYDNGEFSVKDMLNCEPQDIDFEALSVEKKLIEKEKIIKAGFVPLKLSFTVSVVLGIGIRLDVCLGTYRIMAGPAPYVKLSVEIAGGVTLFVLDAKLALVPESEIRAPILIGADKCSFAAEIGLWFTPFTFSVAFVIEAKYVKWSVSWPIYSYSMEPIGKILYKYPTPGQALPASETGNPKPQPKAAHPFDPRKSLEKPELPKENERDRFHFNWYTSMGPIVTPTVKRPHFSRDTLVHQSPPQRWTHIGNKEHVQVRREGIKCNWAEIIGLYAYGYVFIPKDVRVVLIVDTEDHSWISVNGRQVVHHFSSGTRRNDLSNSIRRGEWNLFDAAAAGFCNVGHIGIRFENVEDIAPAYTPGRKDPVFVHSWYVTKGPTLNGLRRTPTEDEIIRLTPPNRFEARKSQSVFFNHHTSGACAWVQMTSLYAKGWMWVPRRISKLHLRVGTADVSYVRLNGVRIVHDGCCGWRLHDITRNRSLKKGAWNLISGVVSHGCNNGFIGFDYEYTGEEMVFGIAANNPVVSQYMGGNTWRQTRVRMKQISVGGRANNLIWGVNPENDIFTYRGRDRWNKVTGKMIQVSVGCDGEVWGINPSHQIYRFLGRNRWEQIPGSLKWVAVGSKNHIWGVNQNNHIFQYLGNNKWKQISGLLSQIAVSCDGSTVVGVNSSHQVYRYEGNNRWSNIPGSMSNISVKPNGDLWGVNNNGVSFRMRKNSNFWVQIAGGVRQVSGV